MPDMTSYDQESLATQVALDPDPVVLPIDQHATPPTTASSLSSATSHSSPPHILLPIPTQSTNQSQPAFALSRAFVSTDDDWTSLPAEVLNADISIAPDGSFVETSSGSAARELKRRYDQYLGVGIDVRSPYAITAFVNQHGKQMYRVGQRDATAPAAEAESKVTSAIDASHNRSFKGRSRISVHNILSQNKPKGGATLKPGQAQDASVSGRKLLRRTRSIPDMFGMAASSANAGPSRQPTPTGRTHSHSVTGADMPRHLPVGAGVDVPGSSTTDIFAEAMQWSAGAVPPSPYSGSSTRSSTDGGYIPYPFGPGVAFDTPSRRSHSFILPLPRALREMQSFDSCLTARAGDTVRRPDSPDSFADIPPESPSDLSPTPPMAVSPFGDDSDIPPPDPTLAPLPETSMHSRYSTEVFDVLQTYRGLPLLDRLFPYSAGETTIRMSLRADDSAAPRDDPRFVLWGETQPTSDPDVDNLSLSQGSLTGMSSPAASHKGKSRDIPSLRVSSDDPTSNSSSRRVIIAGTIERWIAQLTSELNYDELLNFFLTYRTYISAVDLCHLLICRFHWSLCGNVSKQDDQVRKIVKVRTFVAIRYWLLTFFVMDFLRNRELRLLLASWLNTLVRDPVLAKHQDGLSIVRKLIKVVKDCKEAHIRRRRGSVSAHKSSSSAPKPRPTHLLGEKFAEAIFKNEDDSDIDLDFVPDDRVSIFLGNGEPSNSYAFGSTAVVSPPRGGAIPSASAALLQQPLQRNILQQSRASISVSAADTLTAQNLPPITSHHGALSRAFVKTIGRLGRWKRVLNSRQTADTGIAVPANVSAFDLELSATGDLLTVRGGVEQYLKMIEPQAPRTPVHANADLKVLTPQELSTTASPSEETQEGARASETEILLSSSQTLRSVTEVTEEEEDTEKTMLASRPVSLADSRISSLSARTHSTESFGSILTSKSKVNSVVAQVQARPPWRFDVVSIDDLELSDTSSNAHESPPGPPGLRRVLRKLPLRREFEFVRRSVQSVSSMGIRSRDSIASENSAVSSASLGGRLGTNIQQWQVNAIVDSLSENGEDGGVEDALRRLEGQINPQRRKEKAEKVDGWVRAIQERMAAGDFGNERPLFFDEDEDEDEDYAIDQHETGSVRRSVQLNASVIPGTPSQLTVASAQDDYFGSATSETLHISTPPNEPLDGSGPTSSPKTNDAKPVPEDAVPLEILQSRVGSKQATSYCPPSRGPPLTSPSKILPAPGRKSHRCWILNFKVDVLIHHFAMIDRELFLGVKPEELILDDWMSCQEVDVLDWAQYLKDRARWKAESRCTEKTSALAAVRGRFNLMSNFVISEVILTHPNERHTLVAKFIRLAIKAYSYSNFHTLAAILAGLRSEWVKKAMHRHWNRVGPWETHIFLKLCQFVTPEDDFKAMYQAIMAMVDAKPIDVRSHASTIMSGSTSDSHSKTKSNDSVPSACVPFIGVYLSQLYRYGKLPDLIDPTSPHDPVGMDSYSLSFDSPAHPEVFDSLTPLPPSMQLEPLINIHKQRLIAGVIKDLVAGQHLASRVNYAIDKKIFQKCLKIRGLDSDTLHQVYIMYSDPGTGPMRFSGFIPL